MRTLLTIIAVLLLSITAAAQFKPETVRYGYLRVEGKTVRAYYSRFAYESVEFQYEVVDARWSGTSIVVTVATPGGKRQVWLCEDKFKRVKLQ